MRGAPKGPSHGCEAFASPRVGAEASRSATRSLAPLDRLADCGGRRPLTEDERQITVALADDHNVIRAGLRSMLEAEPTLRVIGEAADAESAAKLARDRRPDVLVLDLRMPGADPATDIASLRESIPGMAVVVLTMNSDPRRARTLLRAGAAGFVLKQAAERNLTEAIRVAAGGGSYIDPELGGALAKLEADPLDELSERERELLRLLALGHTNREIGERLFLSVRAIEVNRAKLMEKLGIESRPDLVRLAIAHGVIEVGGNSGG
jgi:two-component system, NarL family, response regulator NreC